MALGPLRSFRRPDAGASGGRGRPMDHATVRRVPRASLRPKRQAPTSPGRRCSGIILNLDRRFASAAVRPVQAHSARASHEHATHRHAAHLHATGGGGGGERGRHDGDSTPLMRAVNTKHSKLLEPMVHPGTIILGLAAPAEPRSPAPASPVPHRRGSRRPRAPAPPAAPRARPIRRSPPPADGRPPHRVRAPRGPSPRSGRRTERTNDGSRRRAAVRRAAGPASAPAG